MIFSNKYIAIQPTTDTWKKLKFHGIIDTYYLEQENNTFQLSPIDFT